MLDLLLILRTLARRRRAPAAFPAAFRAASLAAAVLTLCAPLAGRAQSGSPPDPGPAPNGSPPAASAPAATPSGGGGGFFARLARGIDQANAIATNARLQKAVSINVEQRGVMPIPYNGAMLGVSTVDVRDGAGVRLHVFLHNTGDQALALPAPTVGMFALLDGQGRTLGSIGTLYPESGNGHNAPSVANGTLSLPALERVSFMLLFAAPAADAAELMLRVTGAGVLRGLPARADGGAQQAMQVQQPGAMPNAQQQVPPQPATGAGSGSPP